MNEKPEALRLADAFETYAVIPPGLQRVAAIPCVVSRTELSQAAAELRRLHAENERLHDELRQSSIDITRAEVERLKAENERLRDGLACNWAELKACRASLREHLLEIERLREVLNRFEYSSDGHIKRYPEEEEVIAALRRDAERYRYLRSRDPKEVFNKSGKAAGVWIDWEDDMAGLQLLTGDDADAAIDAAMEDKT